MRITIAILRRAGISAEKIAFVCELAENEHLVARREQNRKAKQNQRLRQQNSADSADSADTLLPLPPPKEIPPTPPKEITPSLPPLPSLRESDAFFENFRKAYPKRKGSDPTSPARIKFRNAVRDGTDPDMIIGAAGKYASECRDHGKEGTEYVMQMVTWLNQKMWKDYGRVLPLFPNGHDREQGVAP